MLSLIDKVVCKRGLRSGYWVDLYSGSKVVKRINYFSIVRVVRTLNEIKVPKTVIRQIKETFKNDYLSPDFKPIEEFKVDNLEDNN